MSEGGSEGSPSQPKRKIKKVMVLSSTSDSESDESVGAVQGRKRRLRVVSDNESCDSSGSSIVRTGARRKRALPKLRDSDEDGDGSGWVTDHSNTHQASSVTHKLGSGFASDSSEGNSDKCSICLMRFTDQQVGTPQTCEHLFCLDCITEWSKNVNTCPVDRITFNSIVVRTYAGGRILRTEPVMVVERRPSVDILVVEDPTVCEICGSADNEELMLLCDGCDLGFHMQCLTPPLTAIPVEQWFCDSCGRDRAVTDLGSVFYLSEIDDVHSDLSELEDLYSDLMDIELPLNPRSSALRDRTVRSSRRSSRLSNTSEEPSTSSGRRGNGGHVGDLPTTSRGSRRSQDVASTSQRRPATTRRRKYKRRRTKTVIVEYEVKGDGKFPLTKRVKRRVKKRKTRKRQPRTVARRSHVRRSVQAKLASMSSNQRVDLAQVADAAPGVQELCVNRRRAGIIPLRLFGNPNELDYFSGDDNDISEGATTAVAARPTSSIFSAYRQARRKMITIPSPPHASSAPDDLLSGILESQSLLHSKKSVMSITVHGQVNIKLHKNKKESIEPKSEEKIDISKGDDASKKVPSYPGQSRGGGGNWGGGYRGNYHRDQGANFNRGNNYDNNHAGSYQNRQGNMYNSNNMHRDESETFGNFPRRPHQYSHTDDSHFDRSRRPNDSNRGPNYPNAQRFNDQNRHSIGSSWQPFSGGASGPRHDYPQPHTRHSFGGFENPLDMRMGQLPESNIMNTNPNELYSGLDSSTEEKSQLQPFQPLPEPPVFKFDRIPEIEKSEDEKSDSGLIIDTDKYDPTEPTLDDDSGDESAGANMPTTGSPRRLLTPPQFEFTSQLDFHSSPETAVTPPLQQIASAPSSQLDIPTSPETVVQDIIAGMDSTAINVPPNILDDAVRQVLKEHRNLIVPPSVQSQNDKSDEESDGDCPNFSIYSATSVHIANNTNSLTTTCTVEQPEDNLEDLVQEDDDIPENVTASADVNTYNTSNYIKNYASNMSSYGNSISNDKSDDVYNEKISKRCPITTNTRNPIKIKINTPSLIKRQVALYDEEDISEEADTVKKSEAIEQTESNITCTENMMDTELAESKISENNINIRDIKNENEDDVRRNEFSTFLGVKDLKQDKNETDEISNKSIDYDDIDSSSGLERYEEKEKESAKLVDNNLNESNEKSENETQSDDEIDDLDTELDLNSQCSKKDSTDRNDEALEKMTESISETEDERSYTPCLDENKSKDTSMETEKEKEKGIEGLDTEMISEDEGNEMFSDNEKVSSDLSHSPPVTVPVEEVTGKEPVLKKDKVSDDDGKKKKKKDSKKEGKEKNKSKGKKSDVAFKKLIKSGKERNYREREKDEKNKSKKDQASSEEREKQRQKRKEKRKDLERYDVRTLVTEKRRIKIKDAFGRDISPIARSRSPSARSEVGDRSPSRGRRSPSGARSSIPRDRLTPARDRRSPLRTRRSSSRGRLSPARGRPSPVRARLSPTRARVSPVRARPSPVRARPTPVRARRSSSRPRSALRRRPRSTTPLSSPPPPARRPRLSITPHSLSPRPVSPKRRSPPRKRRKSASPRRRRSSLRRRRSASRKRPRRSVSGSPKPKSGKKKKRARSERPSSRVRRRESPRKKSPKRKKNKRRSVSRSPAQGGAVDAVGGGAGEARGWSPLSVDSRLLSPRTPPPDLSPGPRLRLATLEDKRKRKEKRRRRDADRHRHGRSGDRVGPSKEVFTSGDNILVSVSFKDQERERAESRADRRKRQTKRDKRKKRKRPSGAPDAETAKPVAIIDLERSPFRELTPSPKNVIVLSDSDHGDKGEVAPPASGEVPPHDSAGPKTPPEPVKFTIASKPVAAAARAPNPLREEDSGAAPEETAAGVEEAPRGPNTPPDPPSSPDAYDPFEPTRSASASPAHAAPSPPRPTMTLEAAQKTNMSADEVLDRRPLSPMEKVMALLQSTRDVSPEPPPPPSAPTPAPGIAAPPLAATAPPVRIVLPSPTRAHQPKLFPAKPSPIKSTPIKPLQSSKLSKLPLPGGDSPYSPGSSDFGDLFEPPPGAAGSGKRDPFDLLFGAKPNKMRKDKNSAAKVPVKLNRKKGNKTQVGVKIDEDNLKILDELPSSAVEMQVKSKFLKKLNRQERVVEEVKLVLKPHYNKKHVTKEEYKHILRRAVPKICHNKTGEINPSKIQALIEAYVKKLRKKHKVGV